VTYFTSRTQWLNALTKGDTDWCVDFTTNLNRDFSRGATVNVADTGSTTRFSLKAFGDRVDENVISATEDAAVMFVESGSLEEATYVDLTLLGSTPVLGWGGTITLGTQKNELVTLELTTTDGVVSRTFPLTTDGFVGFTVRTGGALTKIRFVATNNDTGAGGEIFVLDDVCGSAAVNIVPTAAPVRPPSQSGAGGGEDDDDDDDEFDLCFIRFIPILGDILCLIPDIITWFLFS
jgi:hypothetical protein